MTTSADRDQHAPGDGETIQASLDRLLAESGFELSRIQVEQLTRYRDLLHSRNLLTNLTAVRDVPGIDRRLILESLRLLVPLRNLPRIDGRDRQSLIDVGTGGGLPGMVLAIACPEFNVFLLDATGKKIAFLEDVVSDLGLTNTTTIHARAEEIAHQPRYRNGFDVVTARAVSSLPSLLELCLPFLRIGGHLLLPKGVDIDDELAAGYRAASILGGEIIASDLLLPGDSTIDTRLVTVRKIAPTPASYPRRPGVPSKTPLGVVAAVTSGHAQRDSR